MTEKKSSDKIDDRTPELAFEPETGFLYLTDGRTRENKLRIDGSNLCFWFRSHRKEYPFRLDSVLRRILDWL